MDTVVSVVCVVGGLLLIGFVLDSALRTFVLPRGARTPLTRGVFTSLRVVFDAFARETRSYESRDRVMALYAPVALLGLVVVWVSFVFVGYAAIYYGLVTVRDWREGLELSGSSLFTLGFVLPPDDTGSFLLVFTEAAVGLGLFALLIAYLPTIYGAVSRREVMVAQLGTRAGSPPSAVELLQRYHAIAWTDRLSELWASWELWFAELEETHTSLAVLVFFRSPNPDRSWVTAAGAVLDAASLAQSTLAIPPSPQAGLCIRSGYLALREIADFFDIDYDAAPAAGDPISIDRSEFDAACEQLAGAGVPVRPDRDRAWRDFAGWRVNYDSVLIALAALTMAPYAPWSSDRSIRRRRSSVLRRRRRG